MGFSGISPIKIGVFHKKVIKIWMEIDFTYRIPANNKLWNPFTTVIHVLI
jgi:hypothetical protein